METRNGTGGVKSKGGLDIPLIAGSAAGGVALILIIAILISVFVYRKTHGSRHGSSAASRYIVESYLYIFVLKVVYYTCVGILREGKSACSLLTMMARYSWNLPPYLSMHLLTTGQHE